MVSTPSLTAAWIFSLSTLSDFDEIASESVDELGAYFLLDHLVDDRQLKHPLDRAFLDHLLELGLVDLFDNQGDGDDDS